MIETVLAILLLTVIVGALATVTSQWMRSWGKGISRTQDIDLLAAGIDRIAADLAAAEVVSAAGADGSPEFEGTETAVRFVRTTIDPSSGPELELVQIGETNDQRGWTIARSAAPFFARGDIKPANPVALARGYRLAFAYSGSDGNWRTTWRGMAALPRNVRFRVSDGASVTFSTVTTVRAELPSRCAGLRPPAGCPQPEVAGPGSDRSDSAR